jgi:hypothetical protein
LGVGLGLWVGPADTAHPVAKNNTADIDAAAAARIVVFAEVFICGS